MDPQCTCAFSAISSHRKSKCALGGDKNKKDAGTKDQKISAVKVPLASAVVVLPVSSVTTENVASGNAQKEAPVEESIKNNINNTDSVSVSAVKTNSVAVAKEVPSNSDGKNSDGKNIDGKNKDSSYDADEDEGGEDGLAVLGALALVGAVGAGAYYFMTSGSKKSETSAMEAPSSAQPVIDTTEPQDIMSVTAISGEAYKSKRCDCVMASTFPHRVGKCLWKNMLAPDRAPAAAVAQSVASEDNVTTVEATAGTVMSAECTASADSDATASVRVGNATVKFAHFLVCCKITVKFVVFCIVTDGCTGDGRT